MDTLLHENLADVVHKALGHAAPRPALLVADRRSALARRLGDAYRHVLPHARFVDFDAEEAAGLMVILDTLPSGSLVVLVQSTRFDMGDFRFRLELFRRGLHVIEHPHLGRMADDEQDIYIDALAYDPDYYRGLGASLKAKIDVARQIRVLSPRGVLDYAGPFEDTKRNVGDYTGFTNTGGQFPIGEVFTEPVDLETVHGQIGIAAFGAEDFSVTFLDRPFALVVARGRVVAAPDAPEAFQRILAAITEEEGQVWLRELGFGLNRALTATRRVRDVGTYERMCGVHLSLGAKHAVYPKAGFNKRRTRFHVDVFCDTERVEIDSELVYEQGAYVV